VSNLLKISNYSSKEWREKRMSHGIWDELNGRSQMPVCLTELAEIYEFQNGTTNSIASDVSHWSLISWGMAP
jgi:hypothetical protein